MVFTFSPFSLIFSKDFFSSRVKKDKPGIICKSYADYPIFTDDMQKFSFRPEEIKNFIKNWENSENFSTFNKNRRYNTFV